jgi:hypothetical protein
MKVCKQLLFLSLICLNSFAARTATVYIHELHSSGPNSGALGSAGQVRVSCQNLSHLSQTVEIELVDEYMELYLRTKLAQPGWTDRSGSWGKDLPGARTKEQRTRTMVLAPKAAQMVSILYPCIFKSSGAECNTNKETTDSDLEAGTPTGHSVSCSGISDNKCTYGAKFLYRTGVRFLVQENAGAIVCGTFFRSYLRGGQPEDFVDSVNTPVNGGRPF